MQDTLRFLLDRERAMKRKAGLSQGAKGWKTYMDWERKLVADIRAILDEQQRRAAAFPRRDESGSWNDITWHDEKGYSS